MSNPEDIKSKNGLHEKLYTMQHEIGSAMSSLHMYADGTDEFLDEKEPWVQHAAEHLRAASRGVCDIENAIEELRTTLLCLSRQEDISDKAFKLLYTKINPMSDALKLFFP